MTVPETLTGPYLVTDRADTCASCLLGSSYPANDAICIRLFHEGKSYGFMMVSLALGLGSDAEEQSLFAEMADDLAFALHAAELQREAMRWRTKSNAWQKPKLRQAQKMEALGTLSGGIAHDFNNILGIIIGYTEMARLDAPPGSPPVPPAGSAEGGRSRQGPGQADPRLQPPDRAGKAARARRAPRQGGLEDAQSIHSLDHRNPFQGERGTVVQSDPTQIHQVLMNLCTNAAHAMREHGGILEVSVRDVELTPEAILPHSGLKPGPHVELTVKDTGHGIDPAIRDRIFDPFFTTKERERRHRAGAGGRAWDRDQPRGFRRGSSTSGEGTIFRVLLPAVTSQTGGTGGGGGSCPSGRSRSCWWTMNPPWPWLASRPWSGWAIGWFTKPAASRRWKPSAANRREIGSISSITDMTMPQMTGAELATVLRRLQPDLPVIVCTGFSELLDAEKARSMGFHGYLMKPVILSELARMVRKVLDETGKKPKG